MAADGVVRSPGLDMSPGWATWLPHSGASVWENSENTHSETDEPVNAEC